VIEKCFSITKISKTYFEKKNGHKYRKNTPSERILTNCGSYVADG
jgi:hypothetical protein